MSTKNIGIVLLPNMECSLFVHLHMTVRTAIETGITPAINNPHITLIHIANLNEEAQDGIKSTFLEFSNRNNLCINLPIKAIKATGGSSETGFKWLDLQFDTLIQLANLRTAAVDTFCPLHNGTLSRMFDDPNNFSEGSQALDDITKCGVTFSSYTPHITAWYVNLPEVNKSIELEEIALLIEHAADDLTCYATEIALVELGRNGNAIEIISQVPLCVEENYDL